MRTSDSKESHRHDDEVLVVVLDDEDWIILR